MKKYRTAIIFGGLEILTYFWFNVRNLELFFMIWAFLSLSVAAYMVMNDSSAFIRAGNVGRKGYDNQHTQIYFSEKTGQSVAVNNRKPKRNAQSLIPVIIVFIYFLINAVGVAAVISYLK
ncbi:hypothetical protein [Brassicibacter mesophilus]|uniref:hypothetical protein n=1 Tax=Brassicibacter mesophilus TaxID=745119 RepID=UPI003D1BF316